MTARVLREGIKHLVPARTRHLMRTELHMLRDDGVVKTWRYNTMLTAAWLRNRVNRKRYRLLTQQEASALRKSDTVFVFGSGYSLNDISPAEWDSISKHDVFGFNAFYYQKWVPVDFHLLRGGLYGELRWRGYAGEVVDAIRSNPRYRDTVFAMQEEFLAQFTNQLIGYRLFPPVKGLLRYPTNRKPGVLPSKDLRVGLRHLAGTLSDAVNCAFCLGWRNIVLAGVDLYDSRYFWLPPDQMPTVDRFRATVTAATANALGGNRYDDPHYTLRNGVVELMAEWRRFFEAEGVQLTVYNPRSLLAAVMPVYPRRVPLTPLGRRAVTAVVQARMSSTRFPGKVLAPFRGKPVLEHVLRAVEAAVDPEAVVVATSGERSDDVIEAFARARGTAVVRGDLQNVLARFQLAARSYPSEWILRVTADSPLLDSAVLRQILHAANEGLCDVVTTVRPRTFPKGCNAELIRYDALMEVDAAAADAAEREHVTAFFYNRESVYRIKNVESGNPALVSVDLGVDEPEDLLRLEQMGRT